MRELEGDADAGELRARVAGKFGRHDDAVRRRALHLVMIGDDDVHAERAGTGHLGARADAAVHRDEQFDAAGRKLFDGGRRDPVPLREPVGQIRAHVGAELLEDAHQQKRRRDAVGVVVAVHGDRLAALQRLVEAPAGGGHPRHEVRVVDAVVRVQKGLRRGGVAVPAAHEDLRHDLAHAELRREAADVGVRDGRDAPRTGIVHEYLTA